MNYFKLLCIVAIFNLHVAGAENLKLTGKVDKILESSVRISVSDIKYVAINDKVIIYHKISSGTKIKIGEWKVSRRDRVFVYATPINIIQNAREGQYVEIFSSRNKTIKNLNKKEPIKLSGKSYDGFTNPAEQNALGWNYQKGVNGVTKDLEKAVYWYRKAAMQGYAVAQDNMGWMYQNGLGVEKDRKKAFQWFYKAAINGHINGQNNLGVSYQYGHGVKRDYKKAIYWYKKSANRGKVAAQSNLGFMYMNGLGTKQDYGKAFYWFSEAANKGSIAAQSQLGVFYYNGTGVAINKKRAIELLRKAARGGNENSQINLRKLGLKW